MRISVCHNRRHDRSILGRSKRFFDLIQHGLAIVYRYASSRAWPNGALGYRFARGSGYGGPEFSLDPPPVSIGHERAPAKCS